MKSAVAIALLVGFGLQAQADEQGKVFVASDKRSQITVPSSWGPLELNAAAEIQVGNEEQEAYLVVLNEAKEDLYGWNLDKHSRVTLGGLLSRVAFPIVTGPKALTVAGSPAVQYEIRGAAENRNIIYVHTTVDGPKHFSQIWDGPCPHAPKQ